MTTPREEQVREATEAARFVMDRMWCNDHDLDEIAEAVVNEVAPILSALDGEGLEPVKRASKSDIRLPAVDDLLDADEASGPQGASRPGPAAADPDVGSYRKKPVTVQAIRFDGNRDEVRAFLGDDFLRWGEGGALRVRTLEGALTAVEGDWIIRGVKGEHYPCRPDIFDATYEPVRAAPGPEREGAEASSTETAGREARGETDE